MSGAALWQWGGGQGGQGDRALLRSAKVPLPPVFGAGYDTSTDLIAAPTGAHAEVMRSHLVKVSSVPLSVFDSLQAEAALQLWHRLVEFPEEMPIIAMMGNWPRPEVFFSTT
jgi:hypothetical protein